MQILGQMDVLMASGGESRKGLSALAIFEVPPDFGPTPIAPILVPELL